MREIKFRAWHYEKRLTWEFPFIKKVVVYE